MPDVTKIALLDFDDVLFKTREFIELAGKNFCLAGAKKAELDLIYKKYRDQLVSSGKVYHQDNFVKHLAPKCPGFNPEIFAVLFQKNVVSVMKNLIYEDVGDFLNFLRKNGWRTIIISSGHPDWQRRKIVHSGIDELVDDIILTKGRSKTEEVGRILSSFAPSEIIFIDDNYTGSVGAVKKAFPQIKVFQLVRQELAGQREKVDCDHDCRTLDEIQKLLLS
ncbi:MAG: HAD family hydrolase [Candidatus Niyogibacteria bacterium]|nr:MAG: HAD family hydrolase [Candidatus Niyogibacteria bacterium]